MAELTHYRCPNCGASITNTDNCEYCGSLLVRFTKRGIDLSKTSYLSNDRVYPGLIENLKRNLQLQDTYLGQEYVATDIYRSKEWSINDHSNGFCTSVIQLSKCIFKDGQLIFPNMIGVKGLCVALYFGTYVQQEGLEEYNQKQMDLLERFKQLDSFSLFTPHQCYYTEKSGYQRKAQEYAINFGCDAVGAARLVSEIMEKVYQVPLDENIDIFTNHGWAIDEARIKANKERGIEKRRNANDGCYVATAIYGSYDCPSVWTLRRYRDYTLDKTFAGRAFIKTYYAISPTLVRWFGKTKWFKAIWKPVLDKMVSRLQQKGVQSTPYKDKY